MVSFKQFLMTASALALLTGNALADGGPVPEPPAPPPEPAAPPPEEPAPPPPPAPEPFDHWYVGLHGGVVWADDMAFDTAFDTEVAELDTGWGAGGAIGYRWENGFRGELEGTWRHNSGEMVFAGQRVAVFVFDVDVDAFSAMLNVLYDFDFGTFFVPYIGGGIGGSHVTVDIGGDEDNGWGFSYQFLGGLSVPMPNTAVELFADYRYLATAGLELDFGGLYDNNDEYRTHSVMGGLRFNF
jgi:opacity protein-like surface antigen